MTTAYIISTGNEMLQGNIEDTNAQYLMRELSSLGITVAGLITVGDDMKRLRSAYEMAIKSSDLVITSGGLGPTTDDLTREAAAEVLGFELEMNTDAMNDIKEYFTRYNRRVPAANEKQAMFPSGAEILENEYGTAPGFAVRHQDKYLFFLPGPPGEMKAMFERYVKPKLKLLADKDGQASITKTIKTFGLGESQVQEMIQRAAVDLEGCGLAFLARSGEVHIKIYKTVAAHQSDAAVENITARIAALLGDAVYGFDTDELPQVVVDSLKRSGRKIALAESCTGGMIAKMITDVAGSSEVLWGGIVSYSNQAKVEFLGVKETTLQQYGAVSEATAKEMAEGIRRAAGSDWGLSVTGIAGPSGGSPQKPVGLVYVALAGSEGTRVKELRLTGDRDAIRTRTAKFALDWVRRVDKGMELN